MVREWHESVSPPEKLRHMAQLFGPLPPLRLEVPIRPAARYLVPGIWNLVSGTWYQVSYKNEKLTTKA